MNRDKIILDLCGGTGSWSKPYRDAGYDVRLVTLPDNDVRTYIPPSGVHGILAAPPCTMFSRARTRAKLPRDLKGAMDIVKACQHIIYEVSYFETRPKFWALENPSGFLRYFLGRPAFNFKPSEFGDPSNKTTDLWGRFNFPKKLRTPVKVRRGHNGASAWHDKPGDGNRTTLRAMTPPLFAKAFFEANP